MSEKRKKNKKLNELWNMFYETGNIEIYLKLKEYEKLNFHPKKSEKTPNE